MIASCHAANSHFKFLRIIAVTLLICLTFVTRLTAPWYLENTNDEAHHHLTSWRNRYGTNDVFPIFFDRLKETGQIDKAPFKKLTEIYHKHPEIVSRSLFVLIDPQPPLFPVTAEVVEFLSNSNLIAQRMISVIASILLIYFAWKLGILLLGDTFGLWLAALFAINAVTQIFAGIARPYATVQCLIVLAIYMFCRARIIPTESGGRFYKYAFLVQLSQWMVWAVICPLVLVHFGCMVRKLGFWKALRQSSLYIAASVLLAGLMVVQLKNPTITGQSAVSGIVYLLQLFTDVSPLGHFVFAWPQYWGYFCFVFIICFLLGIICIAYSKTWPSSLKYGLFSALICSILAPWLIGAHLRFMMSYGIVPILIAGIGLFITLKTEFFRLIALLVVLVIMGGMSAYMLPDPYKSGLWGETRFSVIAARMKELTNQGQSWLSWPYFHGNCLYRYEHLSTPILPQSQRALTNTLENLDAQSEIFILMLHSELVNQPLLANSEIVASYPFGYITNKFNDLDQMIIVRYKRF